MSGQELWNMYHTHEEVSMLTKMSVGGDSLLRKDINRLTPNDSMVAGYWGTGEYLSCINQNIYNFYESFLISPGIVGATHRLQGLDERKSLQFVLSVDLGEKDSLPMGILYDSVMGEDQFNKIETADRQNLIIDTLIIDDDISEEVGYSGADEMEYRMECINIVWTDNVIQAGGRLLL